MSCREGIRFPSRNLPGSAEKWGRFVEETLRDLSSSQNRESTNFLNSQRAMGGVHALSAKQLEEIAFAESLANEAQLSADGKSTVWRTGTMPPGTDHKVGDTWFDESDGNKIYTWDGEKWVEAVLGQEALAEEISNKIDNAVDEARDAKDAAVQNANDILTLDSAVNQAADEARDAWNLAVEANQNATNLAPWMSEWNIPSAATVEGSDMILSGSPSGTADSDYRPWSIYRPVPNLRTYRVVLEVSNPASTSNAMQLGFYLGQMPSTYRASYWPNLVVTIPAGANRMIIQADIPVDFAPNEDALAATTYMRQAGTLIIHSGKLFDATDVIASEQAAIDAQDAASQAQIAATEAVTAANGKNKVFRSTAEPGSTQGTTVGDVWWRYSNSNFTGPVIGQWTWSASGWQASTIGSQIIESLTVDKLAVTGGASFPVAVIDSLVGDQAFFNSVLTNRLIVGTGSMIPWLWPRMTLSPNSGTTVTTVNQTTGLARGPGYLVAGGTANEGSLSYAATLSFETSSAGLPNSVDVSPGTSYSVRVFMGRYGSSVDPATERARIGCLFFDAAGGSIPTQVSPTRDINATVEWHEVQVTAPPGAVSMRVAVQKAYWGTSPSLFIGGWEVRPSAGAVMIENGAITGDKLAVNAIQAGSAAIEDGAITNAKIANLDAGKISTGTLDAARIAANSISAAKISGGDFAGKTFSGGIFTGSTFRTAASGARTEMANAGLTVYNSSNQPQVQVGQGITSGMAVRDGAGDMIPLADHVFGMLNVVYTSTFAPPKGTSNGSWGAEDLSSEYGVIRTHTGRLAVLVSYMLAPDSPVTASGTVLINTVVRRPGVNTNLASIIHSAQGLYGGAPDLPPGSVWNWQDVVGNPSMAIITGLPKSVDLTFRNAVRQYTWQTSAPSARVGRRQIIAWPV